MKNGRALAQVRKMAENGYAFGPGGWVRVDFSQEEVDLAQSEASEDLPPGGFCVPR